MSADTIVREPALTEKLQQLIGAIKMLQKMVGNDDQTWLAENVAEARSKGPESAAEVFKIAIANLHATVAKFTLIFKDAVKSDMVGTYAETMEKALVGLVQTSQTLLLVKDAHPLLKNTVNKLVSDVLVVSIKLATEFCSNEPSKHAAHYTGQIWANCDAFEAVNWSQKIEDYCVTLFRAQAKALREAVEELEEALEEEVPQETGEDDEEEEDQDMFLDFNFNVEDRKILPGCILILKAVNSFVTQLHKVTPGASNEVLFQVYTLSQEVFATIDNFSTSIYPPQAVPDVISQAQDFKRLQSAIVAALLSSNIPQSQRDHLTKLQTAVSGIFDKATDMIQNP